MSIPVFVSCCAILYTSGALRVSPSGTDSLLESRQDRLNASWKVDSVLMLKMPDTGSSHLDSQVFPYIPHVSRWAKEIQHKFNADIVKMGDWFKHAPGEDIVGGSINVEHFGEAMLAKLSQGQYGKVLLLHLYRDTIEKQIGYIRRHELEKYGCGKKYAHTPDCTKMKVTIREPKELLQKMQRGDDEFQKHRKLISNAVSEHPEIFQTETLEFHKVLECQGLPWRINRHFGNDAGTCDPIGERNTYLTTHPYVKIQDLIENWEELAEQFKGTKFEQEVHPKRLIFVARHDQTTADGFELLEYGDE
jgi:hypothetical protein